MLSTKLVGSLEDLIKGNVYCTVTFTLITVDCHFLYIKLIPELAPMGAYM